jgi:CBS domain-containing protein
MHVKDVMRREVLTVSPETRIKEAARTLSDNHIGSLIVVKNEKVAGIITERDILRSLADSEKDEIESKIVEDAMTHYVIPITSGSNVESAVKLMIENKIKKLPVIDNGKLVGIITASDIITAQPDMIKSIRRLLSRKYAIT